MDESSEGGLGVIAARGPAGRVALSLAQHTSLSILGTLAATAILAGVRAEWPRRTAPPGPQAAASALPSLTSGGKFAARAEGGADPGPFVTLTALPPILPMFTAPGVPDLGPAAPITDQPATTVAALAEPPAPARPQRFPPARRDIRRVAAPQPARPAPAVIAMARLPDLSGAGTEDPSMWSRSKLAYRQVAAWSGTLVDHLLP